MATRQNTVNAPAAADQAARSYEPALTQVLTRAYALNWEMIAYALILVAALVTRFVDLGTRVMSHDESLHTYYSWRLYEFGEFNHTPLMHGPLLFHMTALSYFLFGDSDFTARIYPALLGVAIVMFPLLLRRWLGRVGAVLAAVGLLISPQLLYYSRYIRHDIPTIFFALVMVYAILQYLDGEQPRRPIWLWVLSGGLLGLLASKEVGFIYIAIFGSFMTLVWVLRMIQDVGVVRRPAGALPTWSPPLIQRAIGHVILLAGIIVMVLAVGGLLRYLTLPYLWTPTELYFDIPLFIVSWIGVLVLGRVWHSLGWSQRGPAQAIMAGLANTRTAFKILTAGLILGALLSLWIVIVIDVIKPETAATDLNPGIRVTETVMSANDTQFGQNQTKEYATAYSLNTTMFVRALTWIGLPVILLIFATFLSAVFVFPGHLPLPWREILLVLLVAFIVTSVLVLFERRSFVAHDDAGPFAANPNASTGEADSSYQTGYILGVWIIGSAVTAFVLVTRFLTNWWHFLNRQPLWDVLILIGTLIVPWLAAFPLYWAGYNLEEYDPNRIEGRETLEAALPAVIPFLMVSFSVGLSWNWKRWLPAMAIFMGLFAFFFTTIFSNQYGLVTGMIGSLGYWLEQQGVRRGSQPQYYYVLTQLPVYEFLFMIGGLLAGMTGLGQLWRWRRDRAEAEQMAYEAAREAEFARTLPVEYGSEYDAPGPDSVPTADTSLTSEATPEAVVEPGDADASPAQIEPEPDHARATLAAADNATGVLNDVPEAGVPDQDAVSSPPDTPPEPGDLLEQEYPAEWPGPAPAGGMLSLPDRLAQPYDPADEQQQRATKPEWLGAFPFLPLVGWWAITMLLGLTIAGEKMPWLTTHLTTPLILLTGWWLGGIVRRLDDRALRDGGWVTLVILLPVAFIAFGHVSLGLFGEGGPFRGREVEDLTATGNWLAALLILIGSLYFIGRTGNRLGLVQLGRMALVSGALVLAVLTARAAYMAAYINYDYATEFLVYAHAGPAVKTVYDEIDHIAELTNEEATMRIVFDDESSWPYTWYFRDFPNYGFLRGEAGSVDPSQLEGARVVVVGNKKVNDVRQILGNRYYEFGYIRLWWPMQEYFNLTYRRVANVFDLDDTNIAAEYFREGMFDIWWDRDYSTYAQAMCIEGRQARCEDEANWGTTDEEREQFRAACEQAVINECANDQRFAVNNWPVSDRMYFFVDKTIAAQVWDAGIGSSTVDIREPEYPEDRVYTDIAAEAIIGDAAGLNGPRGVVVAEDGTIYVADTERNRIVALNAAGDVLRSLGGELSESPNLFQQPWNLDIGPDGNLYVADTWNNRVVVIEPDGTLVRAWGEYVGNTDQASPFGLWGPRDVKIGPDGNVYVADTGGKRVRVYTAEGEWLRDIGTGGTAFGQIDEPVGLAFNPVSGNLYVAEAWNQRITVFDLDGNPLRSWDVNMWFTNRRSFNRPYLTLSPDGTLVYVTDMDDRDRIVVYNLDGQPVFSFDQPEQPDQGIAGLSNPAGVAFGPDGRFYVVDAEQSLVYVFPPSEVRGNVQPQPPLDAVPDDPNLDTGDESGTEADAADDTSDANGDDAAGAFPDDWEDESPAGETDDDADADSGVSDDEARDTDAAESEDGAADTDDGSGDAADGDVDDSDANTDPTDVPAG